ncbi:Maternal effect embryoarrest [Heracleum sosnowskyi]|uniref:Maternal effect embryoarrest n=1 Tax=Heracleum sosnowskyi TaxID=360622 RepID=A0AAD8J164_9APIA|nr:Maternal effect embryoarrest [Heracleum sosnowskyi]
MDEKRDFADVVRELMKIKGNVPAKFDRKDAHIKLLDDLVNVNSLFTLAVFVGLSQASPGIRSLEDRDECNAGPGVAKMLVLYEVVSFACFLLSSLVAKVLKLILSLDGKICKLILKGLDVKDVLLVLTSCASVSGIVLLTLSVVNVVQIRIGLYSCGSAEARRAIWALCAIVSIALVIYVLSLGAAIYASMRGDAMPETVPNSRQSSRRGFNSVDIESHQVPAGLNHKLDDLV